jgi:hypothetical protein
MQPDKHDGWVGWAKTAHQQALGFTRNMGLKIWRRTGCCTGFHGDGQPRQKNRNK